MGFGPPMVGTPPGGLPLVANNWYFVNNYGIAPKLIYYMAAGGWGCLRVDEIIR